MPSFRKLRLILVDPLQPADHQALEVQLRGDPHEERDVQGVVVGGEGTRRRPTDQRVHHRRLHLHEAPGIEELPEEPDQPGAAEEDLLHRRIGDQVQVPLAVARLDVGEAVPLLGERAKGLGQRPVVGGGEGQLSGLAPEERAGDPHEVADVGDLEALELVAEHVLLDVNLELPAPVAELEEGRLAEAAHRHHPPGNGVAPGRGLQRRGIVGGVLAGNVPRQIGGAKAVSEGMEPQCPPALRLLLALGQQLVLFRRFLFVAHRTGGRWSLSYSGDARLGFFTPSSWAVMKSSSFPSSTASTLPVSTPVRRSFTSW